MKNGRRIGQKVGIDKSSIVPKTALPSFAFSIFLLVFLLYVQLPTHGQLRIDRYLVSGRQQLAKSNFSEALQTFNRIILTQEDNWEAWYYRGLTKFYLGDEAGSESDFNKAISLQPNLSDLYLYRGIVKDYRREHYGALEDFNKGISLKPDDPVLHYSRGTTYLRLNNFTRAIEDFDQAIEENPRMHNAFLNRGIARAKLLDRDGAFKDFNEAILLNPFSGEGHHRKGLLLYEIKNYEEALVSLSEAIHKDSTNTQAWYARALTWHEAGRQDSCLADLSRVVKLDPQNAVALYNRALVLSQTGDFENAIADYGRVRELYPNHVLTYFNRGILLQRIGNLPSALEDLSEAIRIYPDFAKAYLVRSSIYKTLGQMEEAQSDHALANEKIMANQGKSQEELALSYSDTTIQFEELISLNSQFIHSYSSLASKITDRKFDPLGFFRLNPEGELVLVERNKAADYQQLKLSLSYPDFDPQELKDFRMIKEAIDLAGNKQFNEALDLLTRQIDTDEKTGPALFMRAVLRQEMIEFVRQTGVLNEVVPLQLGTNPSTGANDFSNQIDYSQVEDDYTTLLELCPLMSEAWYNRGLIRLYSHDFSNAENDFSRALELDPKFAEAWYNRGILRHYADEKRISITGDKSAGCLDLSRAGELGLDKAYGVIAELCGKD